MDQFELLVDNVDVVWAGFRVTLQLLAVSGLASLVIGTLLTTCRVSPVSSLRAFALTYVQLTRNTPLTVVFAIVIFGFPTIGIRLPHFLLGCLALTIYTSSFVAEAIRSGINGVSPGQAEAARAIGMTFTQTLRWIVLPQALRLAIAPLVNVLTALAKNTSIAAGFGLIEASGTLSNLVRDFPTALYAMFLGIAAGYVIIVFAIAGLGRLLESRLAVAR